MAHTVENKRILANVIKKAGLVMDAGCIIDCDVEPLCPTELEIRSHQSLGQLEWHFKNVSIHTLDAQLEGVKPDGHDLKELLHGKVVLNASVLDFLLYNPNLIPLEWKMKKVYFWGTEYAESDNKPAVRFLVWDEGIWKSDYAWLGCSFDENDAAAIWLE